VKESRPTPKKEGERGEGRGGKGEMTTKTDERVPKEER